MIEQPRATEADAMTHRTIAVSIDPALLERFDLYLKSRGMKRSAWIAAKMREQLERWEK